MENEMMAAAQNALEEHRDIETITTEILFFKQTAGTAILEIGKRLIEAKAQLSHGEWLPWLTEKVDFSERSAQNFMRLAEEYRNPQTIADLGASKALKLLALSPSERDDFINQKHEVSGEEKTVDEMTARELDAAIRKQKAAEKKAEEYKAQAEAVTASYDELVKRAQAEVNELTEENERLRKAPKTVTAVETVRDEEEIRKLEDKLNSRDLELEKLDKKLEKMKADSALKDSQIAQAKQNALEASKRANAEAAAAEDLRRRLAVSGSPERAKYSVYFQQLQETINAMLAMIKDVKGTAPEDAEKFRTALRAVLERAMQDCEAL